MSQLNTAKLVSAKIDTTGNDLLKTMYGLVKIYNSHASLPQIEKINILERILVGAGEWLTSHRPKATQTNAARWSALDDLAKQVVQEGAKLGARFLTGPTNWKSIDAAHQNRSYWLEYLSPNHGVGYGLSERFQQWRDGAGPADESFWEYVRMNPPYHAQLVKYYGNTPKAEKRRVVFKNDGKLYRLRDDTLFDTRNLKTVASGDGWAIFVVSPDGKMYAHKHVLGIYHHSTFLGGSAVMAAGEIVVENGVVKCITAKSGHYTPTPDNMQAFVRQFPQIPRQAVIVPDFSSDPLQAYTVSEFKFTPKNPKSLKRNNVQAALPGWAVNTDSSRMVNKIAA